MRDYAEQVKELREGAEWAKKLCAHETAKRQSDAADAIEELLAAVPKQGEWLPHPNPQFIEVDVCSVCGLGTRKMHHCTDGVQTWDEKTFFRYCPWCGAKLQEPPKGVE